MIERDAFQDGDGLHELLFPVMVREVSPTFGGTSIVCLELSGTRAESAEIRDMKFLERMVLHRRCILESALGLPSLRSATRGACWGSFSWNVHQVRFENLVVPRRGGPLAVSRCVFAEVPCVSGRESLPFPP
jgi:hypothetical protein